MVHMLKCWVVVTSSDPFRDPFPALLCLIRYTLRLVLKIVRITNIEATLVGKLPHSAIADRAFRHLLAK